VILCHALIEIRAQWVLVLVAHLLLLAIHDRVLDQSLLGPVLVDFAREIRTHHLGALAQPLVALVVDAQIHALNETAAAANAADADGAQLRARVEQRQQLVLGAQAARGGNQRHHFECGGRHRRAHACKRPEGARLEVVYVKDEKHCAQTQGGTWTNMTRDRTT
jgi:hypothetical protein